MKTKPKIFIFTGPIASCKTFLATSCVSSGKISYLDFDACAYKGGSALSTDAVIDEVVSRIKQIEQNDGQTTIVIDGWFSFVPSWWLKDVSYDTLNMLDEKLAFVYEIIPIMILRKSSILMADIQANPAKYKYREYQNHLERIYQFLFNSLFGWWKDNGKSKETTS